jgi:hypothetical protein
MRGSDNIIKFPGQSGGRDQQKPLAFFAPTVGKGYVRRSPYRKLWYRTEMAFVELNKVDHEHTPSEQDTIRKGVEAAQTLAKEMARAAERILPQQRRSNSEAMTHRREFKEAMRRRIRDIAASRDLSDEEIKPALTLKHHEIAEFTEKHGVNLEWLLEGKGRIFKKDPIRLSPNMTGGEFAAVVTTLPTADQQAIRAMVREILQERNQ